MHCLICGKGQRWQIYVNLFLLMLVIFFFNHKINSQTYLQYIICIIIIIYLFFRNNLVSTDVGHIDILGYLDTDLYLLPFFHYGTLCVIYRSCGQIHNCYIFRQLSTLYVSNKQTNLGRSSYIVVIHLRSDFFQSVDQPPV